MPWGPQYEQQQPSWADRLMQIADVVTRIAADDKKNKQQQIENQRQALITSQALKKGNLDIQAEEENAQKRRDYQDALKNFTGLKSITSDQAQKDAATEAEISNWDKIHALPDTTSRKAMGGMIEASARQAQAKPDYTKEYSEALETLAPYGELGKTYLSGKQDLSDKQIQTEAAAALKEASLAQRQSEMAQRGEEKKTDQEIRRESIAAHEGQRDFNVGLKEQQQQDKLEEQYRNQLSRYLPRNPNFRLQDQKVNAAVHSRQLFEGSRDENGDVHLNQITSPEVALTLATLTSGKTTTNLEEFKAMKVQALQTKIKEMIGFIVGKPVDIIPKEWTENLLHMIDRQGVISEGLRDKYLEQYKKAKPTSLDPDRAANVEKIEVGSSYSEMFGMTPEEKDRIVNPGKYRGKPAATSTGIKLTGEKAKRLDELRRKAAEGALK
jgi:hypothetical protein